MRKTNNKQFTPKIFSIFAECYGLVNLRADLIAGLTVAVVALPLAMALGIACGVSPDKGIITAIIAGFLISLFGGSRVQIGGPTGAFVVVVYNVVLRHGYDGLIISTLLAGVILILAGYARFGRVIKFIPQPVVTGFTAGIAVIIASSQVNEFLGLDIGTVPAEFIPQWIAYFAVSDSVNLATLATGLLTLGVIVLFRRFAPRWPGYLIALIISTQVVSLGDNTVETIGSRFPNIPSGIAAPTLPHLDLTRIQLLLPPAFTIAFLAGIEALLSAMVADGMTGFRHRSNQELIGQGIANIGSALFGGIPATGAIARTATNVVAGGRTPLAGIFHATFLFCFIMLGTDLMNQVPLAVLAAILFVVAYGMSEIHQFIRIFQLSGSDRTILLLTFFLTIFVDLTVAIGVGVTSASLLFMARMSKAIEISNAPKEFDDDSDELDQRQPLPPGVETFWIAGPIFFGAASELMEILSIIGHMPKVLIIRMRLVPYLDATGAAALIDIAKQCKSNKTAVIFSSIQKQPEKVLATFQDETAGLCIEYATTYTEAIAIAKKIATKDKNPLETPQS